MNAMINYVQRNGCSRCLEMFLQLFWKDIRRQKDLLWLGIHFRNLENVIS